MKEDALSAYEGDPAATPVGDLNTQGCALTSMYRPLPLPRRGPLVPECSQRQSTSRLNRYPPGLILAVLFIDHGTGVIERRVKLETVKIYQGVTLGALSFPKDQRGEIIRGAKRHPTLKDKVTIYANATLLGDITVGENAVIGSNTWIRNDVPANRIVQNKEPEVVIRELSPEKVRLSVIKDYPI